MVKRILLSVIVSFLILCGVSVAERVVVEDFEDAKIVDWVKIGEGCIRNYYVIQSEALKRIDREGQYFVAIKGSTPSTTHRLCIILNDSGIQSVSFYIFPVAFNLSERGMFSKAIVEFVNEDGTKWLDFIIAEGRDIINSQEVNYTLIYTVDYSGKRLYYYQNWSGQRVWNWLKVNYNVEGRHIAYSFLDNVTYLNFTPKYINFFGIFYDNSTYRSDLYVVAVDDIAMTFKGGITKIPQGINIMILMGVLILAVIFVYLVAVYVQRKG